MIWMFCKSYAGFFAKWEQHRHQHLTYIYALHWLQFWGVQFLKSKYTLMIFGSWVGFWPCTYNATVFFFIKLDHLFLLITDFQFCKWSDSLRHVWRLIWEADISNNKCMISNWYPRSTYNMWHLLCFRLRMVNIWYLFMLSVFSYNQPSHDMGDG